MVAVVVLAIAPAVVAVGGIRNGDLALVGWGLAAMVGAVGAVYALRAVDRDAIRSTICEQEDVVDIAWACVMSYFIVCSL